MNVIPQWINDTKSIKKIIKIQICDECIKRTCWGEIIHTKLRILSNQTSNFLDKKWKI
jgi:hypothetical protein